MVDIDRVIKNIEQAQDLLWTKQEKDTADHKIWKALDDATDLILYLTHLNARLIIDHRKAHS